MRCSTLEIWHNANLLRYRNNGEIIVFMRELTPYLDMCDKVFNTALGNNDNKLNNLLTLHFQRGRRTVLTTLSFCHRVQSTIK